MFITIDEPYAMTDAGSRPNNEDSVFPEPEGVTEQNRLFLVCDGVGGAERGEVASALACESIDSYFNAFLENKEATPDFVKKAVSYTESCFDTYLSTHPEAQGMATTLALLYLGKNGATLAHIGDSRIYQFRRGEVVYQTEDHSLVNAYIKLGRITTAEAATHPQRNVILRAIQGSKQPVEAEVVTLSDILPGDYFFLCTDGVLQECPTEVLGEIFATSTSAMEIKIRIAERCAGHTRDNFSFYLVPVRNVKTADTPARGILSFFYSLI